MTIISRSAPSKRRMQNSGRPPIPVGAWQRRRSIGSSGRSDYFCIFQEARWMPNGGTMATPFTDSYQLNSLPQLSLQVLTLDPRLFHPFPPTLTTSTPCTEPLHPISTHHHPRQLLLAKAPRLHDDGRLACGDQQSALRAPHPIALLRVYDRRRPSPPYSSKLSASSAVAP